MNSENTPSEPEVTITVSIPVTVGGYTGQREEWEKYTHPCAVTLDGSNIVLKADNSTKDEITIPRHALESAIGMLGQQNRG